MSSAQVSREDDVCGWSWKSVTALILTTIWDVANAPSYSRLHTSVCTIGRKFPRALPILQRSPRKIVYVYILPIRYIWTAHFLHLSFAFTTKNHRKNMKCSARMSNGRPGCTARMSNGRPSSVQSANVKRPAGLLLSDPRVAADQQPVERAPAK